MPTTTAPRGYALPAMRGAGGYFAAKNQYDTAWGNVILAMMTPIGSRPFRRSFGSSMSDALFNMTDSATKAMIERSITESVTRYAPHVNVLGVTVQGDERTLTVLVEFALREEPSKTVQRSIRIDKRTVMNVLAARSR